MELFQHQQSWQGRPAYFLAACVMMFAQSSSAAVQTLNFISLDAKPLYANVSVLPYANPKAPKMGAVISASFGTFDNLNSINGKGTPAEGVQYLYDTLMSSSLDEPGVMYPLLATSITYDPERPKYATFHLNPKARFSDGSPVTAQDVVATFKTILKDGAPGIRIYFSDIADVHAVNQHDVRFDFKSDNNKEMPLIIATVPIFSQSDLKKRDFTRVNLQAPMGSGPYVVGYIDAGRAITYQRNPNYWAKDIMVNRGAYNFNQIKYVYYRSLEVAFEGFKAGQYTINDEKTARRWATEYNFKAVNAGVIRREEIPNHNPIPMQSFVLNTRRKPMDDIYFRQALTYACDFEWQNKALFYGKYKRLQSFFDNSELAATGQPSKDELKVLMPYWSKLSPLMQSGVMANWKYPVSDASGFNRANLLTARKILLDHGYRYNQQGQLLGKDHRPIKLEFLLHQDGLERTLMPFVRNTKRLGIQIDIRRVDIPQYIARKRSYDFDLTTDTLPQTLNPGNEQSRFWGSASADEEGNYNYAGIKNPVIDAVIDQLIRSKNRDALIVHTRVLDRLLRAGYYVIPQYNKDKDWVAYWDMYAHPRVRPKLSVGLDYWWLDAAKAQKVSQYLKRQ